MLARVPGGMAQIGEVETEVMSGTWIFSSFFFFLESRIIIRLWSAIPMVVATETVCRGADCSFP